MAIFKGLRYHFFDGDVVEVVHVFLPFLDKVNFLWYNGALLLGMVALYSGENCKTIPIFVFLVPTFDTPY